ncbi:hypothetical protein PLESTB_000161100 [Pleodorina starrii]|uniref:Phosducin domain-containing protein n=1 Tax=Pleodorina starrii TaxID=330485 RepID=A0A9W6EYB2_9CHLO|nr:hypothetical protein PLESTM_000459400 [Pleodorina starrii]GLC48901.1 hypothetical protein PLESTB_000161100 [Pleodorina starrii]GLC72630.1 hypothetical protein PLESTF_001272500 [Pleodorina starrii]
MEASSNACCMSKEDKDAADAARFGLPDPRELEDDPVLAGCCEEDLHNLRRAEALHKALLDVDCSTSRMKLQQQALHVTQHPQPQSQEPGGKEDGLGEEDDDDDDDELLSELRRRRLAELQRQAAERQQAADQGYGRLNDVAAGALLARVEQLDHPGAATVVAHLTVSGCEAGAVLDEHLTCLAHRHRGTFFARVAVKRNDPLAARLRLEGLPALVCFRSGALVGRAAVSQFGPPGCLVEEEVTSYLQRLSVLRGESAVGGRAAGDAPGDEDAEEQEEEEEWRLKPCDVCGRRYPHEHVRAVYGTCHRRSDSSGEDEGR